MTLVTGSDPNAGSNCAIRMVINGWWGTTEEVEVVPEGRKIEPNSTETFTVRAADVGCPSSIDVKFFPQVGGGMDSKWQAEQITVTHVDYGYTGEFMVKSWFDARKPTGTFYRYTDDVVYKVRVWA